MNIFKKFSGVLMCIGIVATSQVFAEDIDIYTRPTDTAFNPNLNPNILVVIDNSANWASASQHWEGGIKQGEAELKALREVVGGLDYRTNLGLMLFTDGDGTRPAGGYIRFHIRPMTETNRLAFLELIGDPTKVCTDGPNSLNGTPNCILKNFNGTEKTASAKTDYSAVMLDIFKYFGGHTWPAHAQDNVAGANVNSSQFGTLRYAGSPDPKSDRVAYRLLDGSRPYDAYRDLLGNLIPGKKSDDPNLLRYNSPLRDSNNCAKTYVIFIGNGFPSQDSPSSLLGPPSLLPNEGVGGDVEQIPLVDLAVTATAQTTLLASPYCGFYPGTSITASLAACQAKATLPDTDPTSFNALYPGYSSYTCSHRVTCTAGAESTYDTNLGISACGDYSSKLDCEVGDGVGVSPITTLFPKAADGTAFSSHYCVKATSPCRETPSNPTPSTPVVPHTGCIADNLQVDQVCKDYGAANYPNYTGFTCKKLATACGTGKSADFELSASFLVITGYKYEMHGSYKKTVFETTYAQDITGAYTASYATPTGTFSMPTKVRYFDEWARFLRKTDVSSAHGQQNVTTFTIDVYKDQQDQDETALLISAASAGGGKYFRATNQTAITNALKKILSEIQAVNSVFASSSLPVSVNTQGTYLNQVFMGMFRPEASAAPRWPGNLKQYQFKVFNSVLRLADRYGDEAISATTGFITPCADSFWTSDTGRYWDYGTALTLGDCSAQFSVLPTPGSPSIFSDAPDGEVVEKGGAAQRLRGTRIVSGAVATTTNYDVCPAGQTPQTWPCRKLLTCDGSTAASCTSLTNFDTSNSSVVTALGSDPLNKLLWWVRGKDVDNENGNTDPVTLAPIYNEMRPSVHGGVVHSQPAVVDFGGTTGTIAFYGADDGVFHAVDGGQTESEGVELWGFIAPEAYSKFYRLRDNASDSDGDGTTAPMVALPGIAGTPSPLPKDYFFDGSIGVYQRTSTGTVWIFPSMRRGGRAVYAFDVSNPFNPVLKWRRGCFTNDTSDNTNCSTGWEGIGQTWSHPTVAYLNGYADANGPKPVLIFGGGYDQCEDDHGDTDINPDTRQTPTCPGVRKGNNIWIVDAHSGAVLRTYPTIASVPGDVAIVKDAAGNTTSLYAADTGGNVYRINVGTSSADGTVLSFWSSNATASGIRIASLSEAGHARKFLNGPAVVPSGTWNAVLIGSGDREHPLVNHYACNNYSTTAGQYVTNQFYMLIDQPTAYLSSAPTASQLVDVTTGTTTIELPGPTSSVIRLTNVTGGVSKSSIYGWKFNFARCEQSVNEGLVIGGVTYFGTNTPSPGDEHACAANLGQARGYAVDYLTGNAIYDNRFGLFVGGGLPPSPVAGIVDVDGTKHPFCIGCYQEGSTSFLQVNPINIDPKGSRYRSYWYIEND